MSLSREQFYNQGIRPNLARFSTDVKVHHILPHLPCLTLHDRDEITAKKDASGSFNAMQLLLENLRRRDNWPEEFINALRNCEHIELADEMATIYDRIRGVPKPAPIPAPTPSPPAPPGGAAKTTTVTIHTVPLTTPTDFNLSPEDATNHLANQAPFNSDIPHPPPTPVQETQQLEKNTSLSHPPPKAENNPIAVVPSQVPKLNAESKVPFSVQQDTPGGMVSLDLKNTSPSPHETDDPTADAQEFIRTNQHSQPIMHCASQNSEKTLDVKVGEDVDSGKPPIQETSSPKKEKSVFHIPEETSDPTEIEVVYNSQSDSSGPSQATSSAPVQDIADISSSIVDEFFSKPGVLEHSTPQHSTHSATELCSVTSSNLEISEGPTQVRAETVSDLETGSSSVTSIGFETSEEPTQVRAESVSNVETEPSSVTSNSLEISQEPTQFRAESVPYVGTERSLVASSGLEISEEPSLVRAKNVPDVETETSLEISEETTQIRAQLVSVVKEVELGSSGVEISEKPFQNRAEATSVVEEDACSSSSNGLEINKVHTQIRAETFPVVGAKPCLLASGEPVENLADSISIMDKLSSVSSDLEVSREMEFITKSQQVISVQEQTSSCNISTDSASQPLLNTSGIAAPAAPNPLSLGESHMQVSSIQISEEPPTEYVNGHPRNMQQDDNVSEDQCTLNHIGFKHAIALVEPPESASQDSDHEKITITKEQDSNTAISAIIPQVEQGEEGRPELFRINNAHLIAAAGVALSAVFVAWKFKH